MADISVQTIHSSGESLAAQAAEQPLHQLGNGDAADSSRNLLASLNDVHAKSQLRNSADSKTDKEAMQGDNDSIKLADKTSGLADALKSYIGLGGDFKDARGQALGHQFIAALRKERDDHTDDRTTDRQYAGPNGVPKNLQADLQFDSKSIAENAAEINKPVLSPDVRTNVLKSIEAGAAAVAADVTEKGGHAGKDLQDAAAESKVISADAAALMSGKLTLEQGKLVAADIASKAELIQKEVGDVPNEVNYAQHDSAAIKAGADLEAVVRSAMRSHSPKTLDQLTGRLSDYHSTVAEGVLDTVVHDRKEDLRLEPTYIAANNADNDKNNAQILNFTDPYKGK